MQASKGRRRGRSWHVPRQGNTAVEYALFLTLIAGAVILSAEAVGYAIRRSVTQTAAGMQGEIGARHLPLEDMEPSSDVLATLIAPGIDEGVQTYQFGAVAMTMLIGAVVWYGLYCRRLRVEESTKLTDQLNHDPPEFRHDDLFAKRQQILRILSADMTALLESKLEVRHLMSRRLVVVELNTKVDEVRALMDEHNLRHLLVCDQSGQLVGLISDRDVGSRSGRFASQLMTQRLITVEPNAHVMPAITLMINKRISCLPVVNAGVPCGVLTTTDLMMALQCTMQVLQKIVLEIAPAQVDRPAKVLAETADFPEPARA